VSRNILVVGTGSLIQLVFWSNSYKVRNWNLGLVYLSNLKNRLRIYKKRNEQLPSMRYDLNSKLIDTLFTGIVVWAIGYAMGFYIVTIPGYPEVMMQPSMLVGMSAVVILVTGGITYLRFRKRSGLGWRYALVVGGS